MSDIVPTYLSETQKHSGYKLLNNKLIKFDKKKKLPGSQEFIKRPTEGSETTVIFGSIAR